MASQQPDRSSVKGSRNPSPHPSPREHQTAYQAFDTSSMDPTQYMSNMLHHSGQFQPSFAEQYQDMGIHNDQQMYPHNQFNQSAFQGNMFQDQSLTSNYNPNEYLETSGTMHTGNYDQDYSFVHPNYDATQATMNPADLSKISSPDQSSPVNNLLSPESQHSPQAQHASPTMSNGQFHTPQHSRHASLDPSSAYEISSNNNNNNNNWQGVQFQHRRLPSDQHSDVSSVSHHSPYLGHSDFNEAADANRSPYLIPQDTNTYGIESFNIGENLTSQPIPNYVSPRLIPQQGLDGEPQMTQTSNDSLFTPLSYQPYPSVHGRNHSTVSDIGQADQYAPPIINVELVPVSRQPSFGPGVDGTASTSNALSPPPSSRGRNRSQSDLTGLTRPINSRSVSPSIKREASDSLSVRSPSPGPGSSSRASSPGVADGRISKDRRASTSNLSNRDYILDLANPDRPSSSTGTSPNQSSRIQKHPANFQCTLCPKKFTRAYNLRSHLRTHTDERPYVCTVCGKAFARQHDRKRHEGLHSGEKKFVCKGELNSRPGETWGCGRRFARADALGRHFRSEAGRVCIKPLLDEEARDKRDRQVREQMMQQGMAMNLPMNHQQQNYNMGLQPVPPGMVLPLDPAAPQVTAANSFALPAALMAQYPQLANLDWNAISSGQGLDNDLDGDLSDMGGYDDGGGYDMDPNMSMNMNTNMNMSMNMNPTAGQQSHWQQSGGNL